MYFHLLGDSDHTFVNLTLQSLFKGPLPVFFDLNLVRSWNERQNLSIIKLVLSTLFQHVLTYSDIQNINKMRNISFLPRAGHGKVLKNSIPTKPSNYEPKFCSTKQVWPCQRNLSSWKLPHKTTSLLTTSLLVTTVFALRLDKNQFSWIFNFYESLIFTNLSLIKHTTTTEYNIKQRCLFVDKEIWVTTVTNNLLNMNTVHLPLFLFHVSPMIKFKEQKKYKICIYLCKFYCPCSLIL